MKLISPVVLGMVMMAQSIVTGSGAVSPLLQSTKAGGNKVPAELVGKWLNGTFSMSNWWSYDGKKYIGNPYTRSVAFDFSGNGEAQFYLAIKTHTGYCSTEAFTFLKGKLKINEAEQSFTLVPDKGNYRGFYSCASGSNFERPAKPEELKPTTYYWSVEKNEQNEPQLIIRFSPDPNAPKNYFKPASW
jgi:hypothetical protein